jgi:hypothetical protein
MRKEHDMSDSLYFVRCISAIADLMANQEGGRIIGRANSNTQHWISGEAKDRYTLWDYVIESPKVDNVSWEMFGVRLNRRYSKIAVVIETQDGYSETYTVGPDGTLDFQHRQAHVFGLDFKYAVNVTKRDYPGYVVVEYPLASE